MHDGDTARVLVLMIGDDAAAAMRIAIPAANVREVASAEHVTEYPGSPLDVAGLTAIRGQIVPVLDLVANAGARRSIVILDAGTQTLAIAGGVAVRIAGAIAAPDLTDIAPVRLWSGRVLPLVGSVRLHDAPRSSASGAPALPLLDAAALIRDVVDESDGER